MRLNARQSEDLCYFEHAIRAFGAYVCQRHVHQAMLAQKSWRQRRRFYAGYLAWYATGSRTWRQARRKTRANLGAALLACSWFERFRWFVAAGLRVSRTSYR